MKEVLGIDVSHYQGKIDWDKVAASGKQFAILKAMYEAGSHNIDETFEYNTIVIINVTDNREINTQHTADRFIRNGSNDFFQFFQRCSITKTGQHLH